MKVVSSCPYGDDDRAGWPCVGARWCGLGLGLGEQAGLLVVDVAALGLDPEGLPLEPSELLGQLLVARLNGRELGHERRHLDADGCVLGEQLVEGHR